jgi:hypothetical protein
VLDYKLSDSLNEGQIQHFKRYAYWQD